jgi:hypothetical protein
MRDFQGEQAGKEARPRSCNLAQPRWRQSKVVWQMHAERTSGKTNGVKFDYCSVTLFLSSFKAQSLFSHPPDFFVQLGILFIKTSIR